MQETEAAGTATQQTAVVEEVFKPDLNMTYYLPDWFQPVWEFFTPYPWVLTILLILFAYAFGWFLRFVISRSLLKITARTVTNADDHLVGYLTQPLVLTTVTLAMMLAVSAYKLSQGLTEALLSILATIMLFSWTRAGMRTVHIVLELVANNRHRFEVIQERTIPVFSIVLKILIIGLSAYLFMLIWGINPTAWLASAGVIGIAVGFAAKDTLANLFSGISIIADAPYKIGDFIVIDSGERGRVTHLGMRSTRILTLDDVEVTVPNAVIANAKIINESGGPWVKHRIRVPIGVAYGSDIEKVSRILEETAEAHAEVVKQPSARVRMRAFGASSLDFELLVWIDHPELRGRIRHDLLKSTYKAFQQHGIEIPFPQTDIHLRSMPEAEEPQD